MKMIMVICPEARQDNVRELISTHDVHAYTEFREVVGEGLTGKKLGTRDWPEKSVVIFTVVPDGKESELAAALRNCEATLFPGEGMRAFSLPVTSLV